DSGDPVCARSAYEFARSDFDRSVWVSFRGGIVPASRRDRLLFQSHLGHDRRHVAIYVPDLPHRWVEGRHLLCNGFARRRTFRVGCSQGRWTGRELETWFRRWRHTPYSPTAYPNGTAATPRRPGRGPPRVKQCASFKLPKPL